MRNSRLAAFAVATSLLAAGAVESDVVGADSSPRASGTEPTDTTQPGDASESDTTASVERATLQVASFGAVAPATPLYIASTQGYFDEEGLDVEITNSPANILNLVVSGQADIGFLGGGSALTVAADGADTKIIYAATRALTAASVVGVEGIDSIEDCTSVGTLGVGTSNYGGAVIYREALDLDYDIANLADYPALLAGLSAGAYDCAVAATSVFEAPLASGEVTLLVDSADPDLPEQFGIKPNLPDGTLFGIGEDLEEKRDLVVRFLRAIDRGNTFLREASDAEIVTSLKTNPDFAEVDEAVLLRNITDTRHQWFLGEDPGRIAEEDWPDALAYYRSLGLERIDAESDRFAFGERVDMSYLDEATGS